jgi:hypothetical protein
MIQPISQKQIGGEEVVCEGATESKRFHHTILQASKAGVGQIAANVVAGFQIFVNAAEQQGHLRY